MVKFDVFALSLSASFMENSLRKADAVSNIKDHLFEYFALW